MTAFGLILVTWVALGLVLIGLGALVHALCRARVEDADGLLLCFWLGWVALLCVLQLWHLRWPVDVRASALIATGGVVGLGVGGREPWRRVITGARTHLPTLLLLALAAAWVGNRCLGGPQNGDTGFYHMPTVRWFLAYPIVPGLANLFAAFAYNQAYFLYAALLDVAPLANRAGHVANGILVVALLARVLLGLDRVLRGRRRCPPLDLFYALMLPAAVGLVFDVNLTGSSPDVSVFAIEIVLAGQLVALATRPRPRAVDLVAVGLLAAGGAIVKLSVAGLAAATVPVAAVLWLRRARPGVREAVAVLAATAATIVLGVVPWMVRGVILSGYPLYPSTLGGITADWSAPRTAVIAEANLIRYWNGIPDWWVALARDPHWFARWMVTLGWFERDVVLPLGIALLAGMVALGRRLRRKGRLGVPAAIVLPTLGGLAFCFAAAPRARYGAAGFWLLAAQAVVLALDGLLDARRWARALLALTAVGLASPPFFEGRPIVRYLADFETFPRPDLHDVRLETGLVVKVPGVSTCCWDGPLPCTPHPNPALRLRREGDLASGFMIDPVVAARTP